MRRPFLKKERIKVPLSGTERSSPFRLLNPGFDNALMALQIPVNGIPNRDLFVPGRTAIAFVIPFFFNRIAIRRQIRTEKIQLLSLLATTVAFEDAIRKNVGSGACGTRMRSVRQKKPIRYVPAPAMFAGIMSCCHQRDLLFRVMSGFDGSESEPLPASRIV